MTDHRRARQAGKRSKPAPLTKSLTRKSAKNWVSVDVELTSTRHKGVDILDDKFPLYVLLATSRLTDGRTKRAEARSMLEIIVQQVQGRRVHKSVIDYVGFCFKRYVSGEAKTLDAAFGLVRLRPGRQRLDGTKASKVAHAVLERRMAGDSYEDAVAEVSRVEAVSVRRVGDHWSALKRDAYLEYRGEHTPAKSEELSRLKQLFGREPWFAEQARLDAAFDEYAKRFSAIKSKK